MVLHFFQIVFFVIKACTFDVAVRLLNRIAKNITSAIEVALIVTLIGYLIFSGYGAHMYRTYTPPAVPATVYTTLDTLQTYYAQGRDYFHNLTIVT